MSIFFGHVGADDVHAGAQDGFHGFEILFNFVVFQCVVWFAEGDIDGVVGIGKNEFRGVGGAIVFSDFFFGESFETGWDKDAIFVVFERDILRLNFFAFAIFNHNGSVVLHTTIDDTHNDASNDCNNSDDDDGNKDAFASVAFIGGSGLDRAGL